MNAQTSLAASLAPMTASPVPASVPVHPPTTTLPPASSADHTPPVRPDSQRLYGPPGWTVRIGLWRLLEPWLDVPRCLPGETALHTDAVGAR